MGKKSVRKTNETATIKSSVLVVPASEGAACWLVTVELAAAA
jgi:hypothetical protein